MTVLSKPFICEMCDAPFPPSEGAPCTGCGRLLCARHFSWLGSLFGMYGLRLKGPELFCRECRAERRV
jgi:hypothetical protein